MKNLPEGWTLPLTYDAPAMRTYGGNLVSILHPSPDTINILDIAWSLSHQCRYAGHVKEFYSVAEHSVLVSEQLPPELQLAGLLHDAAEAYISDVPTPVKMLLPELKSIEQGLLDAIAEKFKIDFSSPEIKEADRIVGLIEAGSPRLLNHPFSAYVDDDSIVLLEQEDAYNDFVFTFNMLEGMRKGRQG